MKQNFCFCCEVDVAFYSGVTAIGTTATLIDGVLIGAAGGNPYRLLIHNNDNTDSMYLGGEGVTTATGLMVDKGEMLSLTISPADRLYGVSSKEGHNISWLTEPV
jgi:hypothetical protein